MLSWISRAAHHLSADARPFGRVFGSLFGSVVGQNPQQPGPPGRNRSQILPGFVRKRTPDHNTKAVSSIRNARGSPEEAPEEAPEDEHEHSDSRRFTAGFE